MCTYCIMFQSDVTGDCETRYIVNGNTSAENSHNESTLFVSAIRELDGCQNKPSYVEGLFAGVYSKPSDKVLKLCYRVFMLKCPPACMIACYERRSPCMMNDKSEFVALGYIFLFHLARFLRLSSC